MSEFRAVFLLCCVFFLGDIAFGQQVELDTLIGTPDGNQISDVRVAADRKTVSVNVELSESVTPTLTFAENPDRLIADFPNVSVRRWRRQNIPVGRNGVGRVRIGMINSSPPITRVAVDLDSVHPVTIEATDRKVLLNILPALTKRSDEEVRAPNPREEGNATKIDEVAAPTVEGRLAATESDVATSEIRRSSEPSRLRWIRPILTMSVILAMLVTALVSHIQNKKFRRGI